MAAKKKQRKPTTPTRTARRAPSECLVCKENLVLDYKNPQVLEKFLSDRKKILARSRTGVCAKHQNRLAQEIKRARHLALLSFLVHP